MGNEFRRNLKKAAKKTLCAAFRYGGVISWLQRQDALIVLMLHKVNEKPDPLPLTLSPHLLESIIQEVNRRHGFVSLEEVFGHERVFSPQGLRFALTFDDGYRDNYEFAYPVLQRYGTPATIFLSVDHVDGARVFWYERLAGMLANTSHDSLDLGNGEIAKLSLKTPAERVHALRVLNRWLKTFDEEQRLRWVERISGQLQNDGMQGVSPMLTWEMVREMAGNGVQFGSHTLSHPILSRESPDVVAKEVHQSRKILRERLGSPVNGFAYPNGGASDFNDQVIAEVRRAGHTYACTTVEGLNRANADPYQLKRINVHNAMCSDENGRFDRDLFWTYVAGLI